MKVLAFGEILWDIIEGKPHLGGAPLNFAAHFCQLGGDAAILSAVGNDQLGQAALERLDELGLQKDLVQISEAHPTGTVEVVLEQGQPDYHIIKEVAYDYIQKPDIHQQLDKSYDAFYYGTLAQRNAMSHHTLKSILESQQFDEVFCDINLRKEGYTAQSLIFSIQHASILKLNDEEVAIVSRYLFKQALSKEALIEGLMERYQQLKIVIITMGAEGSLVVDRSQNLMLPAYPCKVADTIGAGDSFSATFLYYYLLEGDIRKATDKANRVGAYVASNAGAIPAYAQSLIDALTA